MMIRTLKLISKIKSVSIFHLTVKIIPSQLERKPKNVVQEPEKDWELVPPDGGWGWLILAGAFNTFSIHLAEGLIEDFLHFISLQVQCWLTFWFRERSRAVAFSSSNFQKRSMHQRRQLHGFHRYATFCTVLSVICLRILD